MALETLSKLSFEYPHQHKEKIITALNIDGTVYELHDSKLKQDLDNIISYVDTTIEKSNSNFSHIGDELASLHELINNLSGVDTDTLDTLNAIIEELESGNGTQNGSAWVTLVDKLQGIDSTVAEYIADYIQGYATETYVTHEVSNLRRNILDNLETNYVTKELFNIATTDLAQQAIDVNAKLTDDYYDKQEIDAKLTNDYYTKDAIVTEFNNLGNSFVSYSYEHTDSVKNDYTLYNINYNDATTTLNINSQNISVVTDISNSPINAESSSLHYQFGGGSNVTTITPGSGDINGDGNISISDLMALNNLISAGKYDSTGDLNGDGKLDAEDVKLLNNKLL